MNRMTRFAVGVLGTVVLLALVPLSAFAFTTPSLATAANFAVLGGAGVTCSTSSVTGNVGSALTVTQTACTIAGAIHQGDAVATTAVADFSAAYTKFQALPCGTNLTTMSELGGQTLGSGVYCFNSTAFLTTGILRLTGSGPWVFQIGSAITTAGPGQVIMAGGSACNVYWVTGTAATIGTGTKFLGNILAGSAVTFTGTGSSLMGRALAKTAVTMTGTTITSCTNAAKGGGGDGDENEDHDKDDHGHGDHDGDHDGGDHHGND